MKRLCLTLILLLPLTACLEEADRDFQGYVDGEYLYIAAPSAGWLTQVAVQKGERVAAGAALFSLDPARETAALAESRSRLAQSENDLADQLTGSRPEEIAAIEAQLVDASATLDLAKVTLDRQMKLIASNAASQSQVDTAQSAARRAEAQMSRLRAQLAVARLPAREDHVKSARAAVEAARHAVEQSAWQLAQRQIASPADALVENIVRRPGEYVPANGVVLSLLPPAGVKAIFFVPEPRRAELRPGEAVQVICAGCPAGLTARVSRIASDAEYTPPVIYSRETRAKLVFRVEAMLTQMQGAPLPGQPVTIRAKP